MSLEVGTVVQYDKGIAIVYATYPASNQLELKFLNEQLEVVTKKVIGTSVIPAITTKNTYNVIDNIQTKNDEYFKEMLFKLNKIADPKPKVTQSITSASQRRPTIKVMPSRRTAAEMLSHRYSNSSSSDEGDELRQAKGRRSHRRKSRRYKKKTHHIKKSRSKSNRHKTQHKKK